MWQVACGRQRARHGMDRMGERGRQRGTEGERRGVSLALAQGYALRLSWRIFGGRALILAKLVFGCIPGRVLPNDEHHGKNIQADHQAGDGFREMRAKVQVADTHQRRQDPRQEEAVRSMDAKQRAKRALR